MELSRRDFLKLSGATVAGTHLLEQSRRRKQERLRDRSLSIKGLAKKALYVPIAVWAATPSWEWKTVKS